MATDIEAPKLVVSQLLDLQRPGELGAILDCSASIRRTLTANIDVLRKVLPNTVVRGTTALRFSVNRR
jgi:hypothetical protein